MKIALRASMVPGASLLERLRWLEQQGIEGIELDAPVMELTDDQIRAAFAASPVRVASLDGSVGLLHPDPAERAATKERIRRRLVLGGELGASGVLIVPQFGRVPGLPDLSPLKTGAELERELLILQLRELLPDARAAGLPLFLEPLNRYEAHLVNRVEQGAAIAEAVGGETGVMADFFHMSIEEADIAATIRAAGTKIVHVHVADSNRLQPGRGHLDFRPGFAALKAIGYGSYLGIECRIDGPVAESVAASVRLLREWWAAA